MRMFRGCASAIVTPFQSDRSLDEATLRKLVKRQIDAGMNYVVPCGTTGESPTLTHAEHLRVVEITLEEAKGKVPVLAGAGGNDTQKIIELAKELELMGVDGLLSVTPYYNKPTQEGVYQHFEAIAKATKLPVIIYSVQPRTNVNIDAATVVRLSQIDNIVGIKEASGSLSQVASILQRVPPEFLVISGDDSVTLPVIVLGGQGLISVAGNEIPGPMSALVKLGLEGRFAEALAIQRKYQELMEINFIESSPGPVKYAMGLMGLMDPTARLPIVMPQPKSQEAIQSVLKTCGLLG